MYGALVATVLWGFGEFIAREALGPPPYTGVLARVAQCRLELNGAMAVLNCEGEHSDVHFATAPTPGRPRVVFLGGSSVREPHVSGGRINFPAMVSKKLPKIEVLNLGVPGMQAASIALLVSQIDSISPDLVVIYTGHNDYNSDVFLGNIGGLKLWMIPVYSWLSKSWAYVALTQGSRPTAHQQRRRGGLIGTHDDLAFRARESVDERLESDLSLAVEESPAPVILTTLLRNFGDRPAGVMLTDVPDCEASLPFLGPDGSSPRGKAELAQTKCPNTSIAHWWHAQALNAEGRVREAKERWYLSLEADPVPLRAPPSADRVIRSVAEETGATLVDLEGTLGPILNQRYFVDTLHLSPAGAEVVARQLVPTINMVLSEGR